MFLCKSVDLNFIKTAKYKSINEVEVDASPSQIFEFFEKGESWVNWIPFISKVEWTSPTPFKKGTTRTVTLNGIKVKEVFVEWNNNKRISFYFSETTIPFVKALLEDYQIFPLTNGNVKIVHTVAFEPHVVTKLVGPIMHKQMGQTFKNAILDLPKQLSKKTERIKYE